MLCWKPRVWPTSWAATYSIRRPIKSSGSGSVLGEDGSYFRQATAGATGTKTGTISTSSSWGAITIGLKPAASGALQFAVAPALPSSLPSVTLNGASQTKNGQMSNFAVDDTTGTASGWHVSVNGMYPATSTNDVFVFKVEGGTMKELALLAYSETSPLNSNRYVPSYYSTRGVPAGYLSTIYSLVFDTFVVQPTGPANLLINAKAFGDVYAIQDPG